MGIIEHYIMESNYMSFDKVLITDQYQSNKTTKMYIITKLFLFQTYQDRLSFCKDRSAENNIQVCKHVRSINLSHLIKYLFEIVRMVSLFFVFIYRNSSFRYEGHPSILAFRLFAK